jgi:hypothetical protein
MAVEDVKGDFFENSFNAQAFVQGCSDRVTVGMAKEFRRRYPEMYAEFRQRVSAGTPAFHLGDTWYCKADGEPSVFNLVLQQGDSFATTDMLKRALRRVREEADAAGITALALPRLCPGWLFWKDVRRVIEDAFHDWRGVVYVYPKYILGETPARGHMYGLGLGLVLTLVASGLLGILFLIYAAAGERVRAEGGEASWQSFSRSLAHEVGMALLVAVALTCIVEYFLRRRSQAEHEEYTEELETRHEEHKHQLEQLHDRHKKDLEKDVFLALFGTAIKPDLVEELYRVIFKHKFTRERVLIQYAFSPVDGERDRVLVRQEISFDIRNISSEHAVYRFSPYADDLLNRDHEKQPVREFCVIQDGQVLAALGDGRLLCARKSEPPLRYQLCYDGGKPIEIPIKPGTPAHVTYVVEVQMRLTDSHSWVTMHATDGLEVSVKVHEALSHCRFWLDASHSRPLERVLSGPTHYSWRLRWAVLPFQGVMLIWYPAQESPEQGPAVRMATREPPQ